LNEVKDICQFLLMVQLYQGISAQAIDQDLRKKTT